MTGGDHAGAVGIGSRLARGIIRIASWLVPVGRREDWLGEWRGEVSARSHEGGPVVRPALGAVSHALWLRGDDMAHRVLHLGRDVRYGVRSMRRRPLFAVSVVCTLGLGLGATTAVWTIVDAVLLAPLPYPGSERFVGLHVRMVEWDMEFAGLSTELFTAWRETARGFETIEAYQSRDASIVGAGTPVVAKQARITPGFLTELLGQRPMRGRFFDESEALEGRELAMISEDFWRRRFDGRGDVIGTVLRIEGRQTEVIGVAPTVDLLPDVAVWTVLPLNADHSRVVLGGLRAIGRTVPGVDRAGAQQIMDAAHAEAAVVHPTSMTPFEPVVVDYRSNLVADVRTHLLLLLGAVVVVLLLACVNVASLFLTRSAERRRELAVRTSLGAGRRHLISQVVAESLVLTVAGAAAGLVLAGVAVRGMLALLPAEIPLAPSIGLDSRVLTFALMATLGTATLVAFLPTLRASRTPGSLSGARTTQTVRQRRTGLLLLGVEAAQAAALLIAAGLMLNTLIRMTTASPGFPADGLMFVHLDLTPRSFAAGGDGARRVEFLSELERRARGLPGVRGVAVGSATPFSGMTFMTGVEMEGGRRPGSGNGGLDVMSDDEDRVYFSRLHVDAGYLPTLGLDVVAGRRLEPGDGDAPDAVGLINEKAAAAYWPDESPLGRRIRETDGDWVTIVGVVADFGHPGLPTHGMAELYLPMSREALTGVTRPTLLVRHDGDAEAVMEGIRRAVWSIDPDLPIPAIGTAASSLGASLAVPRFYALLLGSFAALAVLLAAVGTYGVVAHTVARRTREIGIRLALGAQPRAVGALMARDGLAAVTLGLVAGVAAGVAASRLLGSLLWGVEPLDPLTCLCVALTLIAVTGLAIAVPSRRAMRADPVASLRVD